LREVLGQHVEQKGSFVSPDSLRFDFSHFQKMTTEEIRKVEQLVTARIRSDFAIEENRNMTIEEAKAAGAIALFGEKYGDEVRTVKFGNSIELCGGTHISSTGRIGTLRIVSEGAIAAGVRRIEAVTAKGCEDYLYAMEDVLRNTKILLNNYPDVLQGIKNLLLDNEGMKHEIQDFMKEKSEQLKISLIEKKSEINGVNVYKLNLPHIPIEMIKDIGFQLKAQFSENMFFVAGTNINGKPSITVMLSEDLVKKGLHAGNMVREASKHIQGGGGGQSHFATAGGKNLEGLSNAIESIIDFIS